MGVRYLKIILALFIFPLTIKANQQAFGLDEKPGQYLPENIVLLNEDSLLVILNELITKPTLISFVYYHCPSLCPKMLEGIAELVNYTEALSGVDYQIVTLSIDHNESVREANLVKKKYMGMITKPADKYFWRFFIADSNTIRKLTNAVGYEFRAVDGNFVHTTSTVLITPKGMISQYFYGTYFNYMHFAMSVEKAANEEVVPTRLKTLKYCYNYIPEKNRKVVVITMLFGFIVILVSLLLFVGLIFKSPSRTG